MNHHGYGCCRCGMFTVGVTRGMWRVSICPIRRWWNFWRHDKPFAHTVVVPRG